MKTLFNLFLILCTISCNAQKTEKMNTKLTDTEIKELGLKIKQEDTIFMKDGKLDINKLQEVGKSTGSASGEVYTKAYYYQKTLDNGTTLYIKGDNVNGYSKTVRKKDDYFEKFYGYYTTGKIKNTGSYYIKRFNYGIRYYFDENGIVESYEDYNAPYKFSWESVLQFLSDKNIKEEQIVNIYRGAVDGVYGWEIIYKPEELKTTDNVKVLTLDAKTGKVIDTQIRDMSRELN